MMKNGLKGLFFLFLATSVLAACSSDDDDTSNPDDSSTTGVYKGFVKYSQGENHISDENGEIKVTKSGDEYSFDFSNDIPSLKNIKMKTQGNSLINVKKEKHGIVKIIDEGSRKVIIHYNKNGEHWDAEGRATK